MHASPGPRLSLRRPGIRGTAFLAAVVALSPLAINSVSMFGQSHSFDSSASQTAPSFSPLESEIRANMAFLADDELHGRGSGTRDEHVAALFAGAQFQTLGLAPGGDNGTYLEKIALPSTLPPRAQQRIARSENISRTETWNAVAILRGTGSANEVVLLTAHLDHLGMLKPDSANPGADLIYNGADDDASGTAAVLALARALTTGPRPRRTIVFALFGSEEIGGFGNAGFLAHPPVPLTSIVANLEFEMIGRPDPAIPADALWLTGFDRTNLGPELAKHGAHIVADPHPTQNFFRRSDNYALAQQGIVAQSVSSYGLHKDYHQPSDELSKIDFPHMVNAITSMIEPIRWLADTTWRPAWNPGGKP
jgi:hypothetical protein